MIARQTQTRRKRGGQNGFCHLDLVCHLGFPPWLAKTNGKPTKRIVCTLTSESAADGRLTYEKELLDSRKNSLFPKTNHPGFPATVAHATSVKWDILER
jgi:hypothetical protein